MSAEMLDARGLICPLPVLKARKKLMTMADGAGLVVMVTDRNALKDFPIYCSESGHILQKTEEKEGFSEIHLLCRHSTPR